MVSLVFAVDLVGHNSGPAIKNDVVLSAPSNGGNTHVGGGGSSSSYVCVENWECGNWSECLGNDMRRLCNDLNECGTELEKPDIYQECGISFGEDMEVESVDEEADVSPIVRAFSAITGAVIGGEPVAIAGASVFLVLVLGGFFVVIRKKKKKV
jgi:hypothetical protein